MAARSPPGYRLVVTLLFALALHLAAAALIHALWPPGPRRARTEQSTPRAVELVNLAPPALQVHALPPRVARVPATRSRLRRSRPASAPPASRGSSRPLPRSPGLSLRMRPPDLSPSPTLLDNELPAIRRRAAGTAGGRRGRTEAKRVADRLQRWMHRDAGVRNAKLGLAHPALFSLLRRVERRFAPAADMLPGRLRHPGRELLNAYKAGIGTFNRMGSALPLDRWETGERGALAVLPETVKTMAGRAAVGRAGEERSRRLVSEICVKVAPGQHAVLTNRRAFKIPRLDAHTAQAVRRAFAEAPMPTDLPPSEACYQVTVRFGRRLPSSSFGCTFDANFSGWDCSGPGQETFGHQIRLVAVWPEGRSNADNVR